MKMLSSSVLAVSMFCVGCASLPPEEGGSLSPFAGTWERTGPQDFIIVVSSLEVREDSTFKFYILVVGAKRDETRLWGKCRTDGSKLILRFEKSDGPTEDALPFELTAVRDG